MKYIHEQIIKETTLCNLASYVQYEGNVKTLNLWTKSVIGKY